MLLETKILDDFDITVTDYKLLVMIQENEKVAAKNTYGTLRHYCSLPKSKLASLIGTKNSIYLFAIIPTLIKKNLLAKDFVGNRGQKSNKHIRTTDTWRLTREHYQV